MNLNKVIREMVEEMVAGWRREGRRCGGKEERNQSHDVL